MPAPRLWPAALTLLLGALWITKTWLTGDAIRQWRMVETMATVVVVLIALVVWLALFSRLPRRPRLRGVAITLGALALVAFLFRIRGVTGDLRPIVEPRFGRSAALPEPAPRAEPPAPTSQPTRVPARTHPARPHRVWPSKRARREPAHGLCRRLRRRRR